MDDSHECGPDCDHDHHGQSRSRAWHHDHGPIAVMITTMITMAIRGWMAAIHDTTIGTVSLSGGEMNPEKFFPWIQKITQTDGPDILRLKGIIAFADDPDRYVVQGIHMILEGDHQRPWKEGEKRQSRLVFIGRNLDREKLERTFAACAA